MFFDEAIVEFISGTGGSGAVAFHREKHVPRGGPNGADGGRGGSIYLLAERGCRTLYDIRLRERVTADDGIHAHGNKRGKSGKDVYIKVPVGTVVTDTALNEPLCDLNVHGMEFLVAEGGRGGFGNAHYVSSVRQAPNFAQKGAPGDHIRARLELKLLADVGLIGLPNAGKSTLLSQISAAKPKIANYPFTTITPNLGVCRVANETFVVADMPGLIEGASQGHGLGQQFLRHIERTKVLVHIVDILPVEETDPRQNFELIEEELKQYDPELAKRPRILILNKSDLVLPETLAEIQAKFKDLQIAKFTISAATSSGIEPALFEIAAEVKKAEATMPIAVVIPVKKQKIDASWDAQPMKDEPGCFEVSGNRILRMVAMTNLENTDAVRYLHRRLERIGVVEKLREVGAEEGDTVYIGKHVFTFTD